MLSSAVIKIALALGLAVMLIVMMMQNFKLSAQNEQLEQSIAKMNQAWLNSKESTLSGLEIERDLKTDYNQNFISILQLRNKVNDDDLEKSLPKELIQLLKFPPQKVSPYVNKV